ncbi:hypothetical protein BJV74DRAFT_311686 [Russula compacta]|nr:hypothetical protein BJV74DRAFT_311686 [Russula compacta]
MSFLPRNRYYLRVSSSSILPLYVYLDSQHIDWMSDRVLRQVVADLRPKIVRKLRAESDAYLGPGPAPANMKKGTVDVHRGDTYQFAYFLRETDSNSVLIKVCVAYEIASSLIVYPQTRNFVLDTDPPLPTSRGHTEQQTDKQIVSSSRRKGNTTSSSRTKRRKVRRGTATGGNGQDEEDDHTGRSELFDSDDLQADEDGDLETVEDFDLATTKRTTDAVEVADVKVEEEEQRLSQTKPSTTTTESVHIEDTGISVEMDEDEEPKPKLALELKYRGFSNFNRCLCVIVEPWPPQPSDSRAPSLPLSAVTRASSVAPTTSDFSKRRDQRAKTPLFFPDVDDEPTTPCHSGFRTLPPVPLFDDPPTSRDADGMEEWDDNAALMQFSQMLSATGRVGGGDAEEEDEFDGTALFADADEAKEL